MAKVLVVDDEAHICRLIRMNLERVGYVVEVALSGRDALRAVSAAPPDLLVLDTIMPEMSGYEVVTELQKEPATRDIPVIYMSVKGCADAHVWAEETRMLRESGRPYVIKPFNPIMLVRLVKDLLNGDKGGPSMPSLIHV
jgi:two-component system alkaline phosphatase synthesis response regulator PhoP/two-component system response regulator VicR